MSKYYSYYCDECNTLSLTTSIVGEVSFTETKTFNSAGEDEYNSDTEYYDVVEANDFCISCRSNLVEEIEIDKYIYDSLVEKNLTLKNSKPITGKDNKYDFFYNKNEYIKELLK